MQAWLATLGLSRCCGFGRVPLNCLRDVVYAVGQFLRPPVQGDAGVAVHLACVDASLVSR